MSQTDPPRYSLTELANLAGVTPRTIRYYLSQGLIPSPGASGPGAKYGDADLGRLRLIRRLQREHLPLAEIRGRLAGLDDAEIATLAEAPSNEPDAQDSALDYIRRVLESSTGAPGRLASPAPLAHTLLTPPSRIRALAAGPLGRIPSPGALHPPPAVPTARPAMPAATERSQWERITLAPDIELHVRRPLPRPVSKQVDRLVSIARDLLEEDPS